MHRIVTLLAFTVFAVQISAQHNPCAKTNHTTDLHGNQIRASLTADGHFFQGSRLQFEQFDVPFSGENSPGPVFGSGLWVGALDQNDSLHLAANTFRYGDRSDYFSGPLTEDGQPISADCRNWDTIWSASLHDIDRHLTDFLEDGVVDQPIASIFGWPANGNAYFEDYNGFPLPERNGLSAPFYDANHNGIYEPRRGEYPHPWGVSIDARPTQILWYVYNDVADDHANSRGEPLGIEIQQTWYAFSCDDNAVLNSTIFTAMQITNLSGKHYKDCYSGLWTDPQIGCFSDDLIGSYPEGHAVFAYNKDNHDGLAESGHCPSAIGPIPTYGVNPPAYSTVMLNNELSSASMLMHPSVGNWPQGMADPQEPVGKYNALRGLWPDGSPMYSTGFGYQEAQGEITKHIFHGDPNDSMQWSQLGREPYSDARLLATSMQGAFPNGGMLSLDFAFSLHHASGLNHVENVGLMYDEIDEIREMYMSGFANRCQGSQVMCLEQCIYPGDANGDGLVNGLDHLELVAHMGKTGPSREGPLAWTPAFGLEWNSTGSDDQDLKHCDANGDGIISIEDADIIDFYLGRKSEYYQPLQANHGKDISIEMEQTEIEYGTHFPRYGRTRIFFNSPLIDSAAGVAFELHYEKDKWRTVSLGTSNIWQTDSLIFRATKDNGVISYVAARLDRENVAITDSNLLRGYVDLQWDQIEQFERDTTSLKIVYARALLSNGETIDLAGDSIAIITFPETTSTAEATNSTFEIFPNPSSGQIRIETNETFSNETFEVIDASGRLVHSGILTGNTIQLDLDPGLYFLRLEGHRRLGRLAIF